MEKTLSNISSLTFANILVYIFLGGGIILSFILMLIDMIYFNMSMNGEWFIIPGLMLFFSILIMLGAMAGGVTYSDGEW